MMISLFVGLGHSKLLGTNLNAENGDFLNNFSREGTLLNRPMNALELAISKSKWKRF